jgi:hypothetical protein
MSFDGALLWALGPCSMSISVVSGARLPSAVKCILFQLLAAVTPSRDHRRKSLRSAARPKILLGFAAAGALLCAASFAADAQNAGSSAAAPSWLSAALYDPSVKIAGNLPAESGVNFTLAPFAGYVNTGSGTSGQAFSGSSGSVAFPVGQSFGLYTNFTAAALGSNGVYDVESNFYWRAPSTGLIGAIGDYGEFTGANGFKYGLGGGNVEGYFGRVTLFSTAGAFRVQGLSTDGFGTIGAAYYPTDNLQLTLTGYDYGGISGAQGGIEYLLPKPTGSTVAVTVGADGFVGNHGTSGAMARLRFLSGLNGPNNKTLIERRREDDPLSGEDTFGNPWAQDIANAQNRGSVMLPSGRVCLPTGMSCSFNSQCCSGSCVGIRCQ